MTRRTFVYFWGAVVIAVLLLGSGLASLNRVMRGGGGAAAALLVVSALGFVAALFVAGRIVLVAARIQRRARER